jgi:hypothetical protein
MPPHSKNGLPWSQEDLQRLRQLAASGMSASDIATHLDRTKIGVKSKSLALGIALKPSRRGKRRGTSSKASLTQGSAGATTSKR